MVCDTLRETAGKRKSYKLTITLNRLVQGWRCLYSWRWKRVKQKLEELQDDTEVQQFFGKRGYKVIDSNVSMEEGCQDDDDLYGADTTWKITYNIFLLKDSEM